jgi:hypothetical protein
MGEAHVAAARLHEKSPRQRPRRAAMGEAHVGAAARLRDKEVTEA